MSQQTHNPNNAESLETTDHSTLPSRLDRRREVGETTNDVIERLLDETIEAVPIETIVKDIIDYYDDIHAIIVHHTDPVETMEISVYTDDVGNAGEMGPLYDAGRIQAGFETQSGDRIAVPFFIVSCNGEPDIQEESGITPIYVPESGSVDLPLAEGLDRLRSKVEESN